MDDASFGLSEQFRVLHQAGIRHLLPPEAAPGSCGLLDKEPWPSFLAKLPPSPSTIWTYPDLGFDLTGQASKARGELWRRLIQAMQLPKGFVGFFPYGVPDQSGMVWCTDHFIEAMSAVQPATVVVFDGAGHNELVAALRSNPPLRMSAAQIHAAPGPDALLSYPPETFQMAVEKLKAVLFPR